MDADRLAERIEKLEEHRLDHIEKTLDELVARQREMERQLQNYSARWGVLLMVGSALVAGLKLFWNDLMRFMGK